MATPTIDRTRPAALIIDKFGGLSAFAKALDKSPSTCHRWLVSGLIPSRHQAAVLDAAKANRVKLRAQEFIPAEPASAQLEAAQ